MSSPHAQSSNVPPSGGPWLVFGPDWGRHPSVSQHLFPQYLGRTPVVWVETVGLRAPRFNLRDAARSVQKVADFLTGRRRGKGTEVTGLHIVCPTTLPFTRFAWVRRFNLRQVRRAVNKTLQQLGLNQPVLVVTVPSQCDYIGQLGERKSIYYCIDDYALWAGMNRRHVRAMEEELLRRADMAVVPVESLKTRLLHHGKPVHVLSHGVDGPHFADAGPAIKKGAPFEAVYFGMVDERMDQDLLIALADAMPEVVVRLIGPISVPVERLLLRQNIRLEGPVHYGDLPAAVASAGVFILPFNQGELARSCSPIKVKEYLACGRPAVTTALPNLISMAEVLHIARDREEFVKCVREAAQGRLAYDAAKVAAYVADESWRAKADAFARMVEG